MSGRVAGRVYSQYHQRFSLSRVNARVQSFKNQGFLPCLYIFECIGKRAKTSESEMFKVANLSNFPRYFSGKLSCRLRF